MVAYRKTLTAEEAKEHFQRRAEFAKKRLNRNNISKTGETNEKNTVLNLF